MKPHSIRTLILLTIGGCLPAGAHATELVWDGHYRGRGQFFDSLSVSNTNPAAEGISLSMDHRLRLQPGWLVTDRVSLHVQLDLLPYLGWGQDPETVIDPVSGDPVALAFSETVQVPETEDGGVTAQNIQVTRAWGEVDTPIGRFRLGRMPVEWGSGMIWNAGNDPLDEHGDTADRFQLTSLIGPVYVLGAFETNYEGFVGEPDDIQTVTGGVLYKTETAGIGTYNTLRYQSYEDDKFMAYTGDLWGRAEMGPVTIETELAGILGGGALPDTGADKIRLAAFAAFQSLELDNDKVIAGIAGGFGSGDAVDDDDALKTFTFDRDFNMALILFEESMPTLEASVKNEANGGRDYDAIRTGNALRNVMFLRPKVGYHLLPELQGSLTLFASQAAKLPDDESGIKGYGLEFDAAVRYDPFPHTWVQTTVGLWIPGRYYTEYEHETLGGEFDRPVAAVQLVGVVEF